MILVDTSVWVDHLRVADRQLAELLLEEAVLCHPFVVGELACGALNRRDEIWGCFEISRRPRSWSTTKCLPSSRPTR